jgi:hypothetical protein
LRAITAGQPPGSRPPTTRSASGTQRYAVGSSVPVQSNSRWKRERSVRSSVAPWLIDSGRVPGCRSRRTYRKAEPLGAQTHLWQFAA